MSRNILLLPIISLITSCTGPTTDQAILEQAIKSRIMTLDNNYKYQVLSTYGYVANYKSLLEPTTELLERNDIRGLKNELTKWSNTLNIALPKLNESTLEQDVGVSILLILDDLIIKTLESTTHFSEIDPIVFLEQENDSVAFFYVALHAKDSLFKPEVLLELSTGTFPILVDEKTGLAEFTLRKRHKNEKKQFKGAVFYMNKDNGIKIGEFEYPRELTGGRD